MKTGIQLHLLASFIVKQVLTGCAAFVILYFIRCYGREATRQHVIAVKSRSCKEQKLQGTAIGRCTKVICLKAVYYLFEITEYKITKII